MRLCGAKNKFSRKINSLDRESTRLTRPMVLQNRFMFRLLVSVFGWAGAFLRSRQDLALEILALRQQVLVLMGKNPRPTLGRSHLPGVLVNESC